VGMVIKSLKSFWTPEKYH